MAVLDVPLGVTKHPLVRRYTVLPDERVHFYDFGAF